LRKENEFQKNMLKETNKKLVNISENIPGMIYTYQLFPDGKSCFPYASEHIYDVYGVRPSEVVDDAVKIFDVLSPDDIGHVVETIMHSRDTLTLWEDEYRVNHPKKGLIWLKGASKPERQADGSTLWYGYIHETTLQKQLEIELQEKKEAAEASVRSKAEFLAAMSHEIRTPMNGVLGMLSLLDRSELDVVQRHQLRVAASSATSLLGLINDILDFSKIDAGKMDLEHLEFHLVDELQALCESMQFKAQEKGLSLILDTQAVDYPTIVTDPGRLRQVLTNLVSNAVKFTSEGRIAITVSLKPIREGRGRLKIDVSDTGIGIPSEKIPMLFESFTQADSSTTRQFGGTGLGLSIVKKLCELMGGSISATSVVGSGSVFRIDLEIDLGGDIATLSSRRANGETQAKEMIAWPPTTRILLVEDNTTNQIVAQGMLELFGLSADIAANGIEAIEAIKLASTTLPYTVVLMDCQMPEMDGYEATKAVRLGQALRVNQSIPIIAMTANAMSGDREKCMIAGMDDYISKPINIDSLKTVLMKWILHAQERPLVGEILEEKFVEYLLWDEEDALNRLANKRTLLNRIIEAFITDSLMSLELLAKALEEQNSADAQLHAHSLKGSAANVSALKLYNISKQLEEAAKNNNLLEVQKGFLQCQQILDETLSVFKLYLSKERS
jgi:signal transduction histidine kinase/DNA-binding response OmpR family regulator